MRAMALLITLLISGCDTSTEASKHIQINRNSHVHLAVQYIGYEEHTNRTELKELTGVDPVRTEWCAAFVNSVLEESNIPSNKDHKYSLTARAFLDWGQPISKQNISPGDIVVFPRGNQGWQGHVGFYLKTQVINDIEYYWILGGNQSNKVSIELFRANRALGIRRKLDKYS